MEEKPVINGARAGVSKRTQLVKVLAGRPDDSNLILGSHKVAGEK